MRDSRKLHESQWARFSPLVLHVDSCSGGWGGGSAKAGLSVCRTGGRDHCPSRLLAPFLKCLMNDFSCIIELYIDSVVFISWKANQPTGFLGLYSVWLAYLIST